MARHKQAQNCDIRPWLSAKSDCREGRFLQIGNSLFFSEKFQMLSAGAKVLYFCFCMESGGRREFIFPQSAAKKYGIAPRSFRRYTDELIRSGFVAVNSGKCVRQPNEYQFSFEWKK